MNNFMFNKTLIIGIGLIGSSIARSLKDNNIASKIYGLDNNIDNIRKCEELDIVSTCKRSIEEFSTQFDLIIICTPLSSYKKIFSSINKFVKETTLVTDVGSTKVSVIKDYKDCCNNPFVQFIPSHPIAGLEKSGPEHGFAKLFENRYCILTPLKNDDIFLKKIKNLWESMGMKIELMDPQHHDRVLAMTSHIPQLIAYSIVATATELETHLKDEVIKYSAAGFRDFTRLAGSDPIMWRDIYAMNKDAVLEMLGRFVEDLTALQKAIRNNDQPLLEKTFRSTRNIRKIIEEIGQAGNFDPTESKKIK